MKKKILVVDDNRMILKFLSSLLEGEGHTVKTSNDGLSALGILTGFKPDIVFVDLIFPNIGGEKLCQIIRTMEHMKDCYIVIVSAAVAEMDLDYEKIGVNACIAKGPFGQMGKNVLEAVVASESPDLGEGSKSIIGLGAANGVPVYARRMTKELLSRNKHLETILESMAQGILEVYSGKVVYVNSAAVSLFKLPIESILSSVPHDLFDASLGSRIDNLINPEKSSPSVAMAKAVELHGKQVVLSSYAIKDQASTIILLITDVTEQKSLELQLQHARRMDAVGNLAGGIAHNFNNLLMGIQGNVSILIQDKKTGEPGFDELTSVERCVESGADLTRQLLSFAKGGKYLVEPVNINEIVEKSSDMFGRTRKEIRIHKAYEENPWPAKVDPGQIELALMDLYVNAWHAMPKGGSLYIKTENKILGASFVKPHEARPGKYLRICVSDTGVGMDKETLQRIFEPFYTTRQVGIGTGLGLASVFGIIKKHGGFLTVTSLVEKGSAFNIYLPAAKESDVLHKDSSAMVPAKKRRFKGTGTVLIADDEEHVLRAGKGMLEKLGFKVLSADSGEKAIDIFKEKKDTIGLLILDLIMPDMDGGAVFDDIRTRNPSVKVLLSSGCAMDATIESILDRGCNGFIQKPYTLEKLAEKISEVIK